MGFSRQRYGSGLPFPPPRDLPNPGIKLKPESLMSPARQVGSLPLVPPEKPSSMCEKVQIATEQTCIVGILHSQ